MEQERVRMRNRWETARVLAVVLACAVFVVAQNFAPQSSPSSSGSSAYQPKFPGDPARSDSEAAALAYMRVVLRAQRQYERHNDHFATSLADLVHTGTFTKRMLNPEQGDYTVGFKGKKDSFILTMTPTHVDSTHRSFYAEDDGKIHGDENKAADEDSPLVK
jgi:hypothetical protein